LLPEPRAAHDAGVVDEHVRHSDLRDHAGRGIPYLIERRHVDDVTVRDNSGCLDLGAHRSQAVGTDIPQHECRSPLACRPQRVEPPHAHRRTRDEHDFAPDVLHAPKLPCATTSAARQAPTRSARDVLAPLLVSRHRRALPFPRWPETSLRYIRAPLTKCLTRMRTIAPNRGRR